MEAESEVKPIPYYTPNPTGVYRYIISDSFDRFDIDAGRALRADRLHHRSFRDDHDLFAHRCWLHQEIEIDVLADLEGDAFTDHR